MALKNGMDSPGRAELQAAEDLLLSLWDRPEGEEQLGAPDVVGCSFKGKQPRPAEPRPVMPNRLSATAPSDGASAIATGQADARFSEPRHITDPGLEEFSQIRVEPSTRKLSPGQVKHIASTYCMYKIKDLHRELDWANMHDWLTIGVLVKKICSKLSSQRETYHVWEVSDIERGGQAHNFALFLFGAAAEAVAWRQVEGDLILIVNPKWLAPTQTNADNGSQQSGPRFAVKQQEQIRTIGVATDYGVCTFRRVGQAPCPHWINLADGRECGHCIQSLHQRAAQRIDTSLACKLQHVRHMLKRAEGGT